jgi:cyclopropane-fatty-acyl-phospholipid synthase
MTSTTLAALRPTRRSSRGLAARAAHAAAWFPLDRLLSRLLRAGRLEVIDAEGALHVYSGEPGPSVAIRLHDPALYRRMLLEPSLAGGVAYVRGDLTIERGTLYDLVELYAENADRWDALPSARLRAAIERAQERASFGSNPDDLRKDASAHDDAGESFYRLFLDEDLQYSSAYFSRPEEGLEAAQLRKKAHIAAKLLLQPNLEVLDIGSGWGGLPLYLASRFGVRVFGVTLSREQLEVSRRRARQAGLAGRVRFELADYRDIEGSFDRIVSVGMFEHVGAAHYATFFRRVRELLAPNGVALVHTVSRMGPGRPQDAWMRAHVFPFAHVPSPSEVLSAVEHGELWCTDVEILRSHPAETVKRWRDRFAENRSTAVRIAGESFCRTWELYLAAAEASFRRMRHMALEVQLARQPERLPATRDYQLEVERRIAQAEKPAGTVAPLFREAREASGRR